MPKINRCLHFFPSALEFKLVSQLCEDENGPFIYNRITNGHWNGNNGNGVNGNNGLAENGYNGNNVNGNNVNGDHYQKEIQNQRRAISRGRGDTSTLPIRADPPPVQVFADGYIMLI